VRAMEPFLIRRLRICTKQIPGTLKELFSLAFTLGSPGKEKSLPRECQEKTLFMFPPWVRALTRHTGPKVKELSRLSVLWPTLDTGTLRSIASAIRVNGGPKTRDTFPSRPTAAEKEKERAPRLRRLLTCQVEG